MAGDALQNGVVQRRYELAKLYAIVAKQRPSTILEIGLYSGANINAWRELASEEAVIVGLDLNPPKRFWNSEAASNTKQTIDVVVGDSHDPSTFETIGAKFPKGIDFLFIDGDHSYDGVKQDFMMYRQLLNPDGIIAFHDINPDWQRLYNRVCDEDSGEVYLFWREIAPSARTEEIIFRVGQSGYGIGIIYL